MTLPELDDDHVVAICRVLTKHNVAFVVRLMARLRVAIEAGTLAAEAAALRAGAAP